MPPNRLVEIEHRSSSMETDPLEDRVLLTEIVRALVVYPNAVHVTEQVLGRDRVTMVIRCDPRDYRHLIGQQGRVINAVRTIFQAVGGLERRRIEVVLPEQDRAVSGARP